MFDWMFERNVIGWLAFEVTSQESFDDHIRDIFNFALANATIGDRIEMIIHCFSASSRLSFFDRIVLDIKHFAPDDGKHFACLKVNIPESTWKKIRAFDWIVNLGEVV